MTRRLESGMRCTVLSAKDIVSILKAGRESNIVTLVIECNDVTIKLEYNKEHRDYYQDTVDNSVYVDNSSDRMDVIDEQAAKGLELSQQMIDDPAGFEMHIADGFTSQAKE